jgi:hypothetical protein
MECWSDECWSVGVLECWSVGITNFTTLFVIRGKNSCLASQAFLLEFLEQ